ncbi:MAG: hypothetical protein KC613_13565, partial [Myxococcales bacterium]|nr:hypothetical protein [Myxococcales bacterium]
MRFELGWAARCALLLGWFVLPACDDGGGGGGQAPAEDGGVEADGGDCSPGTAGCRCLMDDTCRLPELTCSMGTCQDLSTPCDPAEERCPPAEPKCYTPCRGNIVDPDGTVRVCLADGVIRGCLAGAQCLQGSCTAIAAPNAQVADPGVCARPADCPAFQTCLRGRCYAECEQNAECDALPGNPRTCVHRVCREQCGVDMPCTDPETYCDTGICQKLLPPGEPSVIVPGAFELVDANLVFTASSTTGALRLRNTGTGDLVLTVRKADQISIAPDDTPETIVDQPLPWLTLNGERLDQIEVQVPEGGEAVVALGGADDHGFSRYTGHLEITGPGLPIQRARVAYSTGITGRWSGTAFVFGTFEGGAEIDAWMASKPSDTNIPNAFMQVWASYRNGGLPLDQMGALVQATLTGAWDQPRVRALCAAAGNADGVVCAPFTNADGVIPYVSNVDANPVPAGVVETPFSIEVRAGDCGDGAPDGAVCASGRIDSDVALHYPADPAIDLVFNGDPSGCERENASQGCVTTLAAFDAQMAIGARQAGACRGADAAEATVRLPWLVNGFRPAAGDIEGTEAHECRRGGAPFGGAMLADDQRFAEANPV